jgi:DNA-binding beta-propeller fold protein YncE
MSLSGRTAMLAAPVLALVALVGGTTWAQEDLTVVDQRYQRIRNWARLPEGRTWGSTSAIDVDRDGRSVWVAERCGTITADPIGGVDKCTYSPLAPILKFDRSGKLVKSFGAQMFIYPHGMHVDRDGNIWVADAQGNKEGTKGHQVFKFSPEGKVLLVLGKAGKTGPGPDTFNAPCDVVTAPNGDIFVADGHSASPSSISRIMKFSKDGTFLKAWGRVGSGRGEFRTPHGLAMDSRGRLFVADLGNSRVQIFDQEGQFLDEWKQFSRPNGIYIDKNDILYSVDSQSDEKNHPGWKRGLRGGSVKDGKVAFFISPHETDDPLGYIGEGVMADADGNIYVAEVILRSVTRFAKR